MSATDISILAGAGGGDPPGRPQWVYDLPSDPPPLSESAQQAIVAQIWRRWMRGHKPARAGRQPVVTLFLGPPGSGKTELARKWAARAGVPFLDADTITDLSPDYAALRDVRDVAGAPTGVLNARRERQVGLQLAEPIQAVFGRIWREKYDHAMQWTGVNMRSFGAFIADGFRLVVVWVATPADISANRYWARAQRTGRHYVSDRESLEDWAREEQDGLAAASPLFARFADEFYIASTSDRPENAVRVEPGADTAGALANVRAARDRLAAQAPARAPPASV